MTEDKEIEDFLLSHESFVRPPILGEGDVLGEWRITAFLGRGGSAEVYRASHVKLGAVVAIKVLVRETESARLRFVEEARLLALSLGDILPRFYGYGDRGGVRILSRNILSRLNFQPRTVRWPHSSCESAKGLASCMGVASFIAISNRRTLCDEPGRGSRC